MVATVAVFVDTGAGPTGTNTTSLGPPNIRFKTADDAVIDANNPIPIPTGSPNRSFWKHIYLQCTGGTFTQIDNIKFFTVGTTGNELTTHAIITAKTDAFTFTSGSPKTVTISEAGAIINASGETSNYVVAQMDVSI